MRTVAQCVDVVNSVAWLRMGDLDLAGQIRRFEDDQHAETAVIVVEVPIVEDLNEAIVWSEIVG